MSSPLEARPRLDAGRRQSCDPLLDVGAEPLALLRQRTAVLQGALRGGEPSIGGGSGLALEVAPAAAVGKLQSGHLATVAALVDGAVPGVRAAWARHSPLHGSRSTLCHVGTSAVLIAPSAVSSARGFSMRAA